MDTAITKDPKDLKQVGTRPIRPDGVDKVTGRAQFGADFHLPGMLHGKILRSPHAHAILKKIDTSKAEALPGVKAVITRDDFDELPSQMVPAGEMMINYRDMMRNVMAREKVMYDGHAVAAVAATSASIAEKALALIKVDYKVLPHVIDIEEAMKKGAPILHEDMRTDGVEPKPRKASNVAKRLELGIGDVEKGFKAADIIVEREFKTKPIHQAYIEPHACIASVNEEGRADLWCSTQGHFVVRSHCARLLGMDISKLRVTASEIGGGFGGKTVVYLEPLALKLSIKSGQPVKMVMSRSEVFRATGPTSGAVVAVKVGVKKNGKITAGEATLKYQAGAFAGSPVQLGAMCAFAPYDIANVKVVGFDIVTNRPKVAAYRAPGAPISEYGVECVIDEVAEKLGMDPFDLRIQNGAKEGTQAAYGPKFGPVGMIETVEALKNHKNAKAKLRKNQGRGMASGFWFNIGGETCVSLHVNEDGTVALMAGTPDIGGSRASIALMTAEELGIPYEDVRPFIGDTDSLGYTFLTGGSRATFSSGLAAVEAARTVIGQLRERAAKIWDVAVDDVIWEDGMAKPAGTQVGDFDPLSLGDIAKQAGKTGGPIAGHSEINAQGAAPSFGAHMVDVEVDMETGHVKILRYTAAQDAGKAVHPSYVEGQFQGGAVQGIGWALNEEYVYGDDGRLQNAGFLDYRIPVASDVPMIDTVIVEVPNPNHPFGVRGVGETPLCPPMGAVANAVANATGIRFSELPMSPPKILKAIEEAGGGG
jgi:CO/xanthine dehydrogenase Mo-binding subunit